MQQNKKQNYKGDKLMNNLIPVEFKNQRILTTEQLAEVYKTEPRRITENFSRNEKHFAEKTHYFLIQGEELKVFKSQYAESVVAKTTSKLYLWTERGANRHCKILDTDEAWGQFDNLEETYFRVKDGQALNTTQLSPELQMFNKMFQAVANVELSTKELKVEIQETKEEVQNIRDITGLSSVDWKVDSKNLIVKMAHKLGGNQFIQDVYKEAYSSLEKRASCQLSIRRTNKQKKMALEGVCKSKINAVNKLDIIGEDKKILECFLAIVKELAIKYGV